MASRSTTSSLGSSRSAITDVELVPSFRQDLDLDINKAIKSDKANKWSSFTTKKRKDLEAAINSSNLVSAKTSHSLNAGPSLSRSSLGAGCRGSSGSLTGVTSRSSLNADSNSSSELPGLSISVQNIVNIKTSRSYSMPSNLMQRDPVDPNLLLNPLSHTHPNKVLLKPISQDRNARPNAAFKKRTPNKSPIKSPVKIEPSNFQPQLLHNKRSSLSPLKIPGSGYKLFNPPQEKKIPIYSNPTEALEANVKTSSALDPRVNKSVPELVKSVNVMGQLQTIAKPQEPVTPRKLETERASTPIILRTETIMTFENYTSPQPARVKEKVEKGRLRRWSNKIRGLWSCIPSRAKNLNNTERDIVTGTVCQDTVIDISQQSLSPEPMITETKSIDSESPVPKSSDASIASSEGVVKKKKKRNRARKRHLKRIPSRMMERIKDNLQPTEGPEDTLDTVQPPAIKTHRRANSRRSKCSDRLSSKSLDKDVIQNRLLASTPAPNFSEMCQYLKRHPSARKRSKHQPGLNPAPLIPKLQTWLSSSALSSTANRNIINSIPEQDEGSVVAPGLKFYAPPNSRAATARHGKIDEKDEYYINDVVDDVEDM